MQGINGRSMTHLTTIAQNNPTSGENNGFGTRLGTDPDVIALTDEIAVAQERLDHTKALSRQPTDPALRAAEMRYKKLMDQYTELWKAKYEEIQARPNFDGIIQSLLARKKTLRAEKAKLIERFNELRPQTLPSKSKN